MMGNAPVLAVAALLVAAIAAAWARPRVVVDHARTVLALVAVLSLAAVAALIDVRSGEVRIRLDSSEEPMMRTGDPARDEYREAIANFGDDDVYVIAMETDGVFSAEHLRALRRLSDGIRHIEGVRATESLTNTTTFRWIEETGTIEVGPFVGEVPDDTAALADLQRRALADRIHPRTIVSPDARTAAINVFFHTMPDGEFVARGIDERIRALLAGESTPGRRFYVTGRQHIKAQAHTLMVRDLLWLIPLAVFVGSAVGWVAGGRPRAAILPVGASLVATLWTLGLLAALDRPLNLITIILGPMLICVGNPYGVHTLTQYEELVAVSRDARDAALRCLEHTIAPVLIAGATTVVGFGALLLSEQEAVQQFALFSVVGVLAISLLTVTALPAALSLLPAGSHAPRRTSGLSSVIASAVDGVLRRIVVLSTRRTTAVLSFWIALAGLSLFLVPHIVVDTDYLTFFDQSSRVRRDFASVSDRLTGAVPIYVTVDGGIEGTFRDPANLAALERLQAKVEAIPAVGTTISAVDLISVMNRAVEEDDPKAERVPATRAETTELLFMIPKTKLRRFLNSNHSMANLLVRTGESGSASIRALEHELDAAIAAAALPPGLRVRVTGNSIVMNRSVDLVAGNQLGSITLSAVTIFLIVTVSFRSARTGFLAMIPNLVPVSIFFGMLGAGAAVLSLPTSLIACVALGITIDDTAHYLAAYQRNRGTGLAPAAAAAATTASLGRPIVSTSIMEIGGLAVLALSNFATIREFGYLSATTMLVCLATDLMMTPALLVRGRV
jgi:hydrophobe/amphiphile efflux-3 (HAE3) family protein